MIIDKHPTSNLRMGCHPEYRYEVSSYACQNNIHVLKQVVVIHANTVKTLNNKFPLRELEKENFS